MGQITEVKKEMSREAFNYSDCMNRYAAEHYSLFGRPVPMRVMSHLKRVKRAFKEEDEHRIFECLSKDFNGNEFRCPRCQNKTVFFSDRYKRINRTLKEQRAVRVEKNRTLTCERCSFVFHPLALTAYRNMKLDLRIYTLLTFITDDGTIDLPVASVARIFNISYQTAKRLIDFQKNGNPFSEQTALSMVDRGETHWQNSLIIQRGRKDGHDI